jgi:hypothetical protein
MIRLYVWQDTFNKLISFVFDLFFFSFLTANWYQVSSLFQPKSGEKAENITEKKLLGIRSFVSFFFPVYFPFRIMLCWWGFLFLSSWMHHH